MKDFPNQYAKLIQSYLDGTLSEEEDQELARLISSDPDVRVALREHLQFDDLLEQTLSPERDVEIFTKAILTRRAAERVPAGAGAGDGPGPFQPRRPVVRGHALPASPPAADREGPAKRRYRVSSRGAAFLLISGCLLVGLAFLFFQTQSGSASERERSLSVVRVEFSEGSDARFSAPAVGSKLAPGSTVSTDASTTLYLEYADGSLLTLLPGTELRVLTNADSGDRAKRLYLARGSLSAEVTPQKRGFPMRIATRFAEAEVLGTLFNMTIRPESTELVVDEGQVALSRPGQPRTLVVDAGRIARLGPDVQTMVKILGQKAESRNATPSDIRIDSFTLLDADTGQAVRGFDPIPEDAVIDLKQLAASSVNIRANTSGGVDFVEFEYRPEIAAHPSGTAMRAQETDAPFTLAGDTLHRTRGKSNRWDPAPGRYLIEATPVAQRDNGMVPGPTAALRLQLRK